jgi:hypothetical protein
VTTLEDHLRDTLNEMAAEAHQAPLLQRLDARSALRQRRHRLVAVATAATVAAAVAATTVVVFRLDRPTVVEPVERPPKVFRLSDVSTTRPGPAHLAVTLTVPGSLPGSSPDDAAYLQDASGGGTVMLAQSEWVPSTYSQHLSWDGTRFVRQNNSSGDPRLEIVNLRTGSVNKLDGRRGFCPQLSPDNRTVAIVDTKNRLAFIDARSGRVLHGGAVGGGATCASLAWTPDGKLLAAEMDQGSLLVDPRGRTVVRLGKGVAVNCGMSWSPDGRSILLYDRGSGRYVIHDVNDGSDTLLEAPADALRPLGWAGSRVVWLLGEPGDQRLVTTDQHGAAPTPWMRLDVGTNPVATVQWSWHLSGRAADR